MHGSFGGPSSAPDQSRLIEPYNESITPWSLEASPMESSEANRRESRAAHLKTPPVRAVQCAVETTMVQ